jgi:cytoskeletal protein RodZ
MNEKNKLPKIITELMAAQEIDLEKLAYLTDIPLRFLIALQNGDLNNLPGFPYTRGYLIKIAAALNTEPEPLLRGYKELVQSSGTSKENDKLPGNRFVGKPVNKNLIGLVLITAVFLIFIISRFDAILGIPTLTLSIPNSTLITKSEALKISGKINPGDILTLNKETVYADADGNFESEINLNPGLNTLEFEVKKFLGRNAKFTRQVFYQPE